ncbi:hypothetical protein A9Q83_01415 [Alphaproteobacteria bacterium 46_93_T64]|nr:hypothetical protein A9Q83_01415 [Alphaproteobacteria bacterium 46_93_T64]
MFHEWVLSLFARYLLFARLTVFLSISMSKLVSAWAVLNKFHRPTMPLIITLYQFHFKQLATMQKFGRFFFKHSLLQFELLKKKFW